MADNHDESKHGSAVLFVCTANICRSPMAAALFQSKLKEQQPDWQKWRVELAGTWALEGEAAARNSRQAMAERGLDISNHRSRMVTREMLESYDLILTMEPGHKEAICVEFPSVAKRVFLLSEMEGRVQAVDDPYGGTFADYKKTAEKIEQMLEKGMQRILQLVQKENIE